MRLRAPYPVLRRPSERVLGLIAFAVGAGIVLTRLALTPLVQAQGPFLLVWPAVMIAAYLGGFWPSASVLLVGLAVGQFVLADLGLPLARPVGVAIGLAFGLIIAVAGGLRKSALRRAAADAERIADLQSRLMRAGRLNALGEMVGVLAHELNQPITAFTTYVHAARRLVEEDPPPRDRIDDLLARAGEQALRTRDIVGRIRARLEGEAPTLSTVRVRDIFSDAVAVATAARLAPQKDVQLVIDPDVGEVAADTIQVQQVLLNLLRNAAEAMEGQPGQPVRVAATRNAEGLVEISVADSGPGISGDIAERLFEPFASAKPGGLGLGLPISRGIVRAHGGELWAEPNPEGGAIFRFTLRPAPPAATIVAAS